MEWANVAIVYTNTQANNRLCVSVCLVHTQELVTVAIYCEWFSLSGLLQLSLSVYGYTCTIKSIIIINWSIYTTMLWHSIIGYYWIVVTAEYKVLVLQKFCDLSDLISTLVTR